MITEAVRRPRRRSARHWEPTESVISVLMYAALVLLWLLDGLILLEYGPFRGVVYLYSGPVAALLLGPGNWSAPDSASS